MKLLKLNNFVLPSQCNLCLVTHTNKIICDDCIDFLPYINHNLHCQKCLASITISSLDCAECAKYNFVFNQIYSTFSYDFPLAQILHKVKFQHQLQYLDFLSKLFFMSVLDNPEVDYVIAMPMHSSNYIKRGFNQSYELLKEYLRYNPDKLLTAKKIKFTPPQISLNHQARANNLIGAFEFQQDLSGKTIAIIDDVVTTGSSVNELAQTLLNKNAKRVDVWCLMRNLLA